MPLEHKLSITIYNNQKSLSSEKTDFLYMKCIICVQNTVEDFVHNDEKHKV